MSEVEQSISQEPKEALEKTHRDEGIRVDNVKVEVSFRIGGKRLTISELRDIKKGEVLVLDAHINDPVVMLINGQPKAIGEVCEENERVVFNVIEILE